MRNALIATGLAAGILAGWGAPAWAEHGGGVPERAEHGEQARSVDLNVDVRVNRDGFRLGGQLLGLGHVYGAWLNGEVRADGLSLDGRVQEGGRAFNFKLNAELARWFLGALQRDPI